MADNGHANHVVATNLVTISRMLVWGIAAVVQVYIVQLQNLVDVATDPGRYEVDLEVCLELCDLINQKGGRWPRDAAIAIVRRINSSLQQQAILALSLLDICVKNCGYPFHLQIANKEFLNELVRRFPANPPSSLNPIQWKILEYIQQWNATLAQHPRYGSDLRHINDMYKLLSFKGYRFPALNQEATNVLQEREVLKTEQEIEEEDRKAQEAKLHELIRRGTPADLAQANEIMKTLTGYDIDKRPDYRKVMDEELKKIRSQAEELLSQATSPKVDNPSTRELYSSCKSAASHIQKIINNFEGESDRLSNLIDLNDFLNEVLKTYESKSQKKDVSSTLGLQLKGLATASTPAALIDWETTENPTRGPSNRDVTSLPSAANVLDDLSGLDFPEFPQFSDPTGRIALDSPVISIENLNTGPSRSTSDEMGDQEYSNFPPLTPSTPFTTKSHTPVDEIPPGDPLRVYDKNGLSIKVRRLSREGPNEGFALELSNSLPIAMEGLNFQAAVPKTMSLRLLPASGSTLPPKRNGDVIQPLRLVNPSGDTPKVRFRLMYTLAGTAGMEEGEFELL